MRCLLEPYYTISSRQVIGHEKRVLLLNTVGGEFLLGNTEKKINPVSFAGE